MIYVTDDNTNDGNMLSWQDIGVVKNGADGSKGDPGQPGLSITYKGSMTESEFGNAWAEYLANSPNDIQDVNIGDSYYITDKGTMRICHTIVNRDSCIDCEDCCGWEQYWSETQWTGTPADVLYVRYSNDKESFTDANGTVPGKYIGIITKSADYTPKFEDFKDLWTKWTGEDGFGQEQIFLLTDNTFDGSEGKKLPAPDSGDGSPNYYPEVDIDIANNVKGYTTTLDNVEKTIWFDHPQTPTKDYPYCWVAFRQYDHNTGKYGSWKTAVYTNYAFDGSPGAAGESMITSYVFRWYAATTDKPSPDAPTGGSFKTPLPDESDWSDTITENSDRVSTLWMSMRTFKSNDDNYQQGWSTPSRVADTSDFQFEFTKTDLSQIENYTPSTFTGDEQAWRTYEKDRGVEWLDQEKDALYMATAVCHNGIWADWKVTKIKGEKGDPGDPGSSVKFSGEFDTLQSLKQE